MGPEQPLTADTQKLASLIGTNWQCLCRPELCAQSCELIVMPNDPPGQINTNNPPSRLSSSLTIENLELGKTVAQSDGVEGRGFKSRAPTLAHNFYFPLTGDGWKRQKNKSRGGGVWSFDTNTSGTVFKTRFTSITLTHTDTHILETELAYSNIIFQYRHNIYTTILKIKSALLLDTGRSIFTLSLHIS